MLGVVCCGSECVFRGRMCVFGGCACVFDVVCGVFVVGVVLAHIILDIRSERVGFRSIREAKTNTRKNSDSGSGCGGFGCVGARGAQRVCVCASESADRRGERFVDEEGLCRCGVGQ